MLQVVGCAMGIMFCLCIIYYTLAWYKGKVSYNKDAIETAFECQKTIYKAKDTIKRILDDPNVSNNAKKRIKEAVVWSQY